MTSGPSDDAVGIDGDRRVGAAAGLDEVPQHGTPLELVLRAADDVAARRRDSARREPMQTCAAPYAVAAEHRTPMAESRHNLAHDRAPGDRPCSSIVMRHAKTEQSATSDHVARAHRPGRARLAQTPGSWLAQRTSVPDVHPRVVGGPGRGRRPTARARRCRRRPEVIVLGRAVRRRRRTTCSTGCARADPTRSRPRWWSGTTRPWRCRPG